MSNWKTFALLGASILAVTSCSQSAETLQVSNAKHREIEVKEETHYLELSNLAQGYLKQEDRRRVEDFALKFGKDGYGPIVLSAPEGSQQAPRIIASIKSILSQSGVLPDKITVGGYRPAANEAAAPLVMAFKTYEAHVPGCSTVNEHDWTDLSSNTALPSFGCAVNENIAMMIAKPGDLLGQREIGPGDSSRQLTVYEKYRLGESTASSQEADGGSTQ
ncbi:CpaD family pilus assembly protein [Hirschia litorea]|uniref:CpaD family pilus assembly protein n=1 Tax=Hirschia litorea TaxID=1199156 RepID=A0ABW2IK81_9PROT